MSCRTVLVVDADQGARALCTAVLRESGYFVIEAHDGISGWHQVSRYPPDLITMEQPATVYGGRTLLDSLRANPRTEGVKVIFVSALAPSPDHLFSEDGTEPYLPKPLDPHRFLEVVAELIGPSADEPEQRMPPPEMGA